MYWAVLSGGHGVVALLQVVCLVGFHTQADPLSLKRPVAPVDKPQCCWILVVVGYVCAYLVVTMCHSNSVAARKILSLCGYSSDELARLFGDLQYGPRFRCETICIFCKKSWSQRANIEIQDVWLIWSLRLPISSIWNSESYHFLHGFVIDVWWLLDFGIPATQSTQFQQKSQAAPSTSCCSSSKLGSGTESLGLRGAWMLGFKQLFLV